ncbi:methionine--tRNA ligase [Mucisphaera sp.]|uniref:methionine--tRNA ligase n=1 Tax=Mucisphaera sp. TaxID=2913024 RepID=UPI003D0D6D5E
MTTPNFYITTPIYYVNASPHIGHIYTTTIADVLARYHRLLGDNVHFLTGTDEHGKKVADAAREKNITPQAFVDAVSAEFQAAFAEMKFTHNDFIRTTQPRHETLVQTYIKQLIDSGDVYLGEYEGWYDEGQEEYVTETNARTQDYKSAISGRPLTKVKEKNYFFRLSKYEDRLKTHIENNPQFIQPDARRNEVLGRIRDGLNDIAISRSTEPWGVPMPGDAEHSIYVWIDALFNYLTAVEAENRSEFWPANLHVVGKEILWFHAVIWPAMLMALDKPIYHQLYAHSFWIAEGRKMSKSLGNFIDFPKLQTYANDFGLDAVRWFLTRYGPMAATDADFSHDAFIEAYNQDLANTIGNSTSRVTNMLNRYLNGTIPGDQGEPDDTLQKAAVQAVDQFRGGMQTLKLADALANGPIALVQEVDGYIERTAPFKLAKDPANLPQVGGILANCAEALRIASVMLHPVIPHQMTELWNRFNLPYASQLEAGETAFNAWTEWGGLKPGDTLSQGDPLYPRYNPPKA